MRKAASGVVLTAATGVLSIWFAGAATAQSPTVSPTTSPSGARTCADFRTQPEAQQYFNSRGGSRTNNVDNLDPNRNGIACEGLPGTPSTAASPTPAPAATAGATARPLPNNGVFSDIMAMSGLSLLEAGIALSLLSGRIRSRGKRVPLLVLKKLAKASRQGRNEVALADDLYIVRKPAATAGAPKPQPAAPRRDAQPTKTSPVLLTSPIEQAPAHGHGAIGDEWSAAVALDDQSSDPDWPYFTPPA